MTDPQQPPAQPPPSSRRALREAARRAQAAADPAAAPPTEDPLPALPADTLLAPPADTLLAPTADPVPARPVAAKPPRTGRGWRLPIAAALLALWSASCFVGSAGPLDPVVVVLASLAPFLAVAAVAVGTLAARSHRWVSLGVAVIAGALPWLLMLGYAVADRSPAGGDTSKLTVLVVNAHAGRADPGEIVAAVRVHDVDLLVVTELSRVQANDLTEAQLGQLLTPQWFDVRDDPEAGLGIWSELDVSDAELLPDTTWPAVRAAVQTRTGSVTVVAGHAVPPVPASTGRWARDLRSFAAAARGRDPVLLVGTFNASPWHAEYRRMLRSAGVADAADVRGRGLRPTWPTWTPLPLVPMDAALVSDDLAVRSADTVSIDGTDHRALLVELEPPPGPPGGGVPEP